MPDHTVTIDVTQDPIKYSDEKGNDAYYLEVYPTNTVSWMATSSGQKGNQKHAVGIFFPDETPFVDNNNRPVYAFVWSDRDEGDQGTPVATVDPHAPQGASYKYVVAVFDSLKPKTYIDDPKIIIGTGSLGLHLKELEGAEEAIKKISLKVEEKLKAFESKFEQLIKKLK